MKNKIPFDIIADSALVFCCAIATVCVIPSAYSVPYSLGILILWALPTAFAICAALRKCETTWKVCLVSLGMTLVYGFLWRIRILYAVRLVRYSVFRLLALDFSFMPIPSMPEEIGDPALCVTKLLIFSAALVSLVSALLLIKCRSRVPAFLVPIPAFIPALIYTDCAPAIYIFAFLLIYWGGLLFGRFKNRKDENK